MIKSGRNLRQEANKFIFKKLSEGWKLKKYGWNKKKRLYKAREFKYLTIYY